MKYKVSNFSEDNELPVIIRALTDKIKDKGNELAELDDRPNFVLNFFDIDSPKPFRRRSQEEKVVSVTVIKEFSPEMKSICYSALVKSLSNMLFCISIAKDKTNPTAYSITPEAGFLEFRYDPESIYNYMLPVISSHFVLGNRLVNDLHLNEDELIPEVQDLEVFGKELQQLGLLPAPFPLSDFLGKDLRDQLFRLYQVKGLSYGNLSIRNKTCRNTGTSYWMTARGVDKSHLLGIGKDVLLVKGYDSVSGEMLVSVPDSYDPKIRVSVDAIEHYLIYSEFPDIGAIVHLHAWMDDILCTTQTHPCGTIELAENVVAMLRKTANPRMSAVGLKNHGLTITGPDIWNIFQRIRGRLKTSVPMMD